MKKTAPDVPKSSVGVAQVQAQDPIESHFFDKDFVHLVKVNKTQVYFGGARVGEPVQGTVVVYNCPYTYEQGLELDLRIKDSDDFYMQDENGSLVSRRKLKLEPR
ncbi:hypothetical protein DAPPUDRAFT_272103 [Daphnia pulex]|uniref:Uncharacterized protein n=1 Tax=Daphnia pulex TaxID=6669 RepID=E9I2R7_DAPPU|nr:hypothetical protein DAPPUDRAFT_272103 [Daphnia pulex]|eukprot:EFX61713.1 hypothetical protein DAPPUDRAFT_272103 [Daphnia pulex]